MWFFLEIFPAAFFLEMPTFQIAIKLTFGRNRFGEKVLYNLQTRIYFQKKLRD